MNPAEEAREKRREELRVLKGLPMAKSELLDHMYAFDEELAVRKE